MAAAMIAPLAETYIHAETNMPRGGARETHKETDFAARTLRQSTP